MLLYGVFITRLTNPGLASSFYVSTSASDLEDENDYTEIEKFYNKLREIDHRFNTDEFLVLLFGEKSDAKYDYQPCCRHASGPGGGASA